MAGRLWVLLTAAVMAAAAATVALVMVGPSRPTGSADAASKRFEPVPVRARAFRGDRSYLTAWLQRRARLYNRPEGRVVTRLGERTRWGTPRILSVVKVRRRGKWLGVLSEHRPNGRLGWIRASATRPGGVREALVADLSRRRVTLLRDGRRVLRFRVAIGRPANPTPRGRFAVTDILRVRGPSPYGCCVLALSARQRRVPAGWTGGDRLALHATADASAIGRAVSIGCLRARDRAMHRLLREKPQPGTPVFIRR
jgi:L,D-transpeptidase catalytic domain